MTVSAEQLQCVKVVLTWDEVIAVVRAAAAHKAEALDLREGLYLVRNPEPLKTHITPPGIASSGRAEVTFEITGTTPKFEFVENDPDIY